MKLFITKNDVIQNSQELKCLINSEKFACPLYNIPPMIAMSSKKRTIKVIVSGILKSGFGEW